MDASQQIHVEALPSVLVLHMKRFLYDTTAKGVVKINKHIEYKSQLEIPQGTDTVFTIMRGLILYSDIMTPACRSAQSPKYKLFAGQLYRFLFTTVLT